MDTTRLSNFKPFNDLKSVHFFTILSTDENCCFLNMKISIKKEINHESISDDKKKTLENLLVSKLSPCLSTIPRDQLPPKSQLFNFYIKPQNG